MTDLLVSWPGGSLESALRLGALILLSYALILWLGAVVWVYRDVRSRTNDQVSQLIAVVLVAVFNVPGLVVYLVIRPQHTLADAYERSLEAESILHELQLTASSCQNCRRPIDDDFKVCPHCRIVLREPCRACGQLVRTSWVMCPYCATDRAPSRVQPIPAAPAQNGAAWEPPRRQPQPANETAPTQRRQPQRRQQQPRQPASAPPTTPVHDEAPLPRRPAPTQQQIDPS